MAALEAASESEETTALARGDLQGLLPEMMTRWSAQRRASEVAREEASWGADLLVVHHPLFLRGVHGFAETTPKGRTLATLVRAGLHLRQSLCCFR